MSSDHEAEIRASVSAHQDLGPGYDDAVAEGLVERIGAEIDKRIDAQLRRYGAPFGPQAEPDVAPSGVPGAWPPAASPGPADPIPPAVPLGYPTSAGYLPGGYPAYPGYPGPMLPPGYQLGPPPARPSQVAARNVANTVTALGSMALGVAATAIVANAGMMGGRGFIILLIWAAVAIINVAYARRP